MEKVKIAGENTDLTEMIKARFGDIKVLNQEFFDGSRYDSPVTESELQGIRFEMKRIRLEIAVLESMKELVHEMTGSTLISTESATEFHNILIGDLPSQYTF